MGHRTDAKMAATALQLNTAGIFALLGGDDDDRDEFFQIRKGITTPAQWRVILGALDGAGRQMEQVRSALQQARQDTLVHPEPKSHQVPVTAG